MPFLIQAILLLAVLGFGFWLLQTYAKIASPFREVIYFIVVIAVIFWLLEGFGIVHSHYLHWR